MTSILLSTGKSKKVASRVFGQNVFNEMNTSLCYTPSPGSSKSIDKKTPGTLTRIEEGESQSPTSHSTPTPTVLFQPVDNENASEREKRVSFAQDQKENNSNIGSVSSTATSITSKNSSAANSLRNAELNRLRASRKQSPMRRDLVKMTEATIDDVTRSLTSSMSKEKGSRNNTLGVESVFQSLNASRTAKLKVLREKSKEAKSVRFQWDQENTEAKSMQAQADEHRRQIRTIQRKLTSDHFKNKARHDESEKMDRYAKFEKEYMFKSEVFQDHQHTLKEERDKNRKMSIDARAKIRINNREGEEILKTIKLEEEQAMFEVRTDLHRSRMECKKSNAEKRRLSFQFRAGDAVKIRDVRSDWREKDLHEKHVGFELERAAAKDVDNYKKKMRKEEQDDFKERNQEAFKCRKRDKDSDYEAMLAEHESYELKWAGERDADAYRKQMKEEKRKSLAGRNKESAQHAETMEELRSLAKEKEAESYMLKFNGENDAKAYLAKCAEERRKSLQLRGKEARKIRQYEEEEHSKAIETALIDGALQSDCQKDVENYKAECAERDRKSFQFRGKQGHLQRLEEEERRLEQLKKDEDNFKLERLAQKDVQEYYKDCRRRKRKSLALRAKEMRQHVEWKNRTEQIQVEERAHTTHLNSLDIQHMALAKERERARKAMDAMRAAGFNFKGNPFGDLLG